MSNEKWVEQILKEVEETEEIRSCDVPVIGGYYLNEGIYFDCSLVDDVDDDNDWD